MRRYGQETDLPLQFKVRSCHGKGMIAGVGIVNIAHGERLRSKGQNLNS